MNLLKWEINGIMVCVSAIVALIFGQCTTGIGQNTRPTKSPNWRWKSSTQYLVMLSSYSCESEQTRSNQKILLLVSQVAKPEDFKIRTDYKIMQTFIFIVKNAYPLRLTPHPTNHQTIKVKILGLPLSFV